jgi:hypothetical protein
MRARVSIVITSAPSLRRRPIDRPRR